MPTKSTPRANWNLPVAYAQGEGNYTTLHYPDGSTRIVSYTLAKITTWLNLIRIHKAIAVNPEHIISVIRHDAKQMTVYVGKLALTVARRRVQEVTDQLDKRQIP